MLPKQLRRSFGVVLVLIGVILYIWGKWPVNYQASKLTISPADMGLTEGGEAVVYASELLSTPAILETRDLTIETPRVTRVGDSSLVRLAFVPQPVSAGQKATTGMSDVYDSHQVSVEARLVIGGLEVRPQGLLSRPLVPAQPVNFEWQLDPLHERAYEGTAWFYLRFLPKDGGRVASRPIAAQRLEIRTSSLLGLSGPGARLAGALCLLIGGLLNWEWLAYPAKKALRSEV